MSELIDTRKKRQVALKDLITRLHDGDNVDDVKADFKKHFGEVSATELAMVERDLIENGLPVVEIQRLCDIHASIFSDSVTPLSRVMTDHSETPGHPIHTMRRENEALEAMIERRIRPHLDDYTTTGSRSSLIMLREDLVNLSGVDIHYSKKENLFFPFLEQYGITAPPKVMWGVDNDIRTAIKSIRTAYDSLDSRKGVLWKKADAVLNQVMEMVSKEEDILFPLLIETLQAPDWKVIADGGEEIGYFLIDSVASWHPPKPDLDQEDDIPSDGSDVFGPRLYFPTGNLLPIEVEKLINLLPVDVTFVDRDDIVRYFSQGKDRIFTRTPAVIGRNVANCHPPESVHVVKKILASFKSGEKEQEDFWLRLGQRFVLIRYYAVRSDTGIYMGTLEVTQDIAPIQEITGEKRLQSDT